ncbi:MAG: cupin domain-containing protein [Chloroflexi bacterium]|nr:cupin domain-containing protein [Chloroflexota bacterium]
MQRVKEQELKYRDGDSGVKYLFRGPHVDWGVILMLPGQSLGGHYHRRVEETFYVVQGSGTFTVNGQQYKATVGDVFRLEPEDRHDIVNDGDEPLKMVFIKYPFDPEDKVSIS